ncbi:hypothetical protein JJJ17_02005 [Paracoccus caeni]|uniref:Inner membrane protein n=2 Tax=Paracoccus caeni TaxID=657651 RepID=A0A934VYF6_9RHOB|nr:hypothetical protein [Paracoccus caeni]
MTGTDVKKPEDARNSSKSKASGTDDPSAPVKLQAAKPGIIASTDTGPGDGTAAAAGGGEIKPASSTLVGDGNNGRPAAEPKPAAAKATTSAGKDAPKATPFAKTEPVAEKPAEKSAEKPATKPADKPAEKPNEKPAIAAVPAPVTVKKTGFWPVLLGGVCAAAIGAAATIWALPHLPASWLPEQPAAPETTVDTAAIEAGAVAAAEAAMDQRIAALRAELEAAPAVEGDDGAALAELRQQLQDQAARIEELAIAPAASGGVPDDTEARIEALTQQAAALEQQIQSSAQQVQTQISEAQAEAQRLQEAAEGSTRRAEAVAAIASLQSALDQGVTAEDAQQTLEGAGIETPEALSREIASLDSLKTTFGDAARAALRASLREESASGGGNVLTNFLRAQTGARSVEPREGDDADAILSRANAEVEAGRIGAALEQISALSDAAKAAPDMAGWIDRATAYRDAQAALSDLSTPSN